MVSILPPVRGTAETAGRKEAQQCLRKGHLQKAVGLFYLGDSERDKEVMFLACIEMLGLEMGKRHKREKGGIV